MAPQRSGTLLYILIGGMIVYTVIGAFIIRRWALGRAPRRPVSAYADPEGWIHAWLPLLIAVEAFALGGGVFAFLMILVALPTDQAPYTLIGAGGGIIVIALCLAGLDIAWVARVRALARRRPAGPAR
jgi:hypothetical protein